MNLTSLKQTYENRQILLLGGLGFLGKVLLAMLLTKLPGIQQIYLVLRSQFPESAQDRFLNSLRTSPVFGPLREEQGDGLLKFVNERVTIIDGDVSLPNFGIGSPSLVADLQNDIDLVINAAGLVTFNPDFLDAFGSNVQGAIHASHFVKQSRASSLLHISTCYVAGNISGPVPEALRTNTSPNGRAFNGAEELRKVEKMIQDTPDKDTLRRLAMERAQAWGWPNIYTYTKALAEAWLDSQKEHIRFTILRPSILESTLTFPFPGWNEGFNTTAPILKFGEEGFRFIVAKNSCVIDILPIDICCVQLIKIGALLLTSKHALVYQCATSAINPLSMQRACSLSSQRYRNLSKAKGIVPFLSKIAGLNKLRAVGRDHPLSCFSIYAFLSKIPAKWVAKSRRFRRFMKTTYAFCKTTELLEPFMYHNHYTFISNLVNNITVTEPEWETNLSKLDWDHYWVDIHMPGLEKWCFPKMEEPV